MSNPNKVSPPEKQIDWARVRTQHLRQRATDPTQAEKHERALEKLDRSVPEEKGGNGRK